MTSDDHHEATWDPEAGRGSITLRPAPPRHVVSRFKTVTAVLDYDRETSELVAIQVVVGPHVRKGA